MSFETKADLVSGKPKVARIVKMPEKDEFAPSTFEFNGSEMSYQAKAEIAQPRKITKIVQMPIKEDPAPSTFESKTSEISFEAKADITPPKKTKLVQMPQKKEPAPSTFQASSLGDISFEAKPELQKQRVLTVGQKKELATSIVDAEIVPAGKTTPVMTGPTSGQGGKRPGNNQNTSFEAVGGSMFAAAVTVEESGGGGDNSPPPKGPVRQLERPDRDDSSPIVSKKTTESDEPTEGSMFNAPVGEEPKGGEENQPVTGSMFNASMGATPSATKAGQEEEPKEVVIGSMFGAALEGAKKPATPPKEQEKEVAAGSMFGATFEEKTEEAPSKPKQEEAEKYVAVGTMFEAVLDEEGTKPLMRFPKQGEQKVAKPRVVTKATEKKEVPPPSNSMFRGTIPEAKPAPSTSMFKITESEKPQTVSTSMFRMKEPEEEKPPPSMGMFRMKEPEEDEYETQEPTAVEETGQAAVAKEQRPLETEDVPPPPREAVRVKRIQNERPILNMDSQENAVSPPSTEMFRSQKPVKKEAPVSTEMFRMRRPAEEVPPPSTSMFSARKVQKVPAASLETTKPIAKEQPDKPSAPAETKTEQQPLVPDEPQGITAKAASSPPKMVRPRKIVFADSAFEAPATPKRIVKTAEEQEPATSTFKSSTGGKAFEQNIDDSEKAGPPRRAVKMEEKKETPPPKTFSSDNDGISFEAKQQPRVERPKRVVKMADSMDSTPPKVVRSDDSGMMFAVRRKPAQKPVGSSPAVSPPPAVPATVSKKMVAQSSDDIMFRSTSAEPAKKKLVPFGNLVKNAGTAIGGMFRPRVQSKPPAEEQQKARLAEEARQQEKARVAEQMRLAEEKRISEEKARIAEQARLAEEQKFREEARIAEQERLAEQQKLQEEARLAKEAQLAEEVRLKEELQVAEAEEARRLEQERAQIDVTIPYDATVQLAFDKSDRSIPYAEFKTKYLAKSIADVIAKKRVADEGNVQKSPVMEEKKLDVSIPYDATVQLAYEKSGKSIPFAEFKPLYLAQAVAEVIAKKEPKLSKPAKDVKDDFPTKSIPIKKEPEKPSKVFKGSFDSMDFTVDSVKRTVPARRVVAMTEKTGRPSSTVFQGSSDSMDFTVAPMKQTRRVVKMKEQVQPAPSKVFQGSSDDMSFTAEPINQRQASRRVAIPNDSMDVELRSKPSSSGLFQRGDNQGTFESDGSQFVYKSAKEKRLFLAQKVAAQMAKAQENSPTTYKSDDSGINTVVTASRRVVKPAASSAAAPRLNSEGSKPSEPLPRTTPGNSDNGSMRMSSAAANTIGTQSGAGFRNIQQSKLDVGSVKTTGLDIQKFAKFVGDGLHMVLEESQKKAITVDEARKQKKERERKKIFGFEIGPSEEEMAAHLMEEGKHLAIEGGKQFAKFASDGLQMVYHAAEMQTKEYMASSAAVKKEHSSANKQEAGKKDGSSTPFFAAKEPTSVSNQKTTSSSAGLFYAASANDEKGHTSQTNPGPVKSEEPIPPTSASSMLRSGGRMFAKFVGDGLQMVQSVTTTKEKRYRRPPK